MKNHVLIVIFLVVYAVMQVNADERVILMVDDEDILYRSGTVRFLNTPEKYAQNPVIKEEYPWELAIAWTSVYRNPVTGKYQLWYQGFAGYDIQDKKLQCVVCYAESDDGIVFIKPKLNLFAFGDIADTNIVLVGAGGYGDRYGNSVIVDERESDPNKRYKMLYYDFITNSDKAEFPGFCAAFSPDGIHWTPYEKNPLDKQCFGAKGQLVAFSDEPVFSETPRGNRVSKMWRIPLCMSDAADVFYDPRLQEFAVFGKFWIDGADGRMCFKHAMGRTTSKDFVHWSKPQLVLTTDDFDPDYLEFHTSPVFYYNGIYFCLNQMLNRQVEGGTMYIELMTSRDGFQWLRNFRKCPFITNGPAGSFDSGSIFTNSTPVILDEEVRFYYGGYDKGAVGGGAWITGPQQVSGVGFGSIPLNRFAGIKSAEKTVISEKNILNNRGQITLKPIAIGKYKELYLNASAAGYIKVEILNEEGYRLHGFSEKDAVAITGDSLSHPVAWKDKVLGDLEDGKYMIRLHLDDASVFAVRLK